ncbi:MAG: hypothetical protein IJU81_03220 [Bacteroidales bacterium]|nr:hypothetical protein [Bacteroidales bacterium]
MGATSPQRLLVYNPEHDLCLANGNSHYVPPRSALLRAERGAHYMLSIYGSADAEACAASRVQQFVACHGLPRCVIAWGWDAVLKETLLKQGIPAGLLPSDDYIGMLRQLQHRATLLPLKPGCRLAATVAEVASCMDEYGHLVLKAPWSGAGRGLRWASHSLTPHDEMWVAKTIATQGSVVVEPRRAIELEFALEYMLPESGMSRVGECLMGYSLFEAKGGVYTSNKPLPDSEIESIVGADAIDWCRRQVEPWIAATVAPSYHGPLGIDCYRTTDGQVFVSEHNMRHTMGMVAHGECASFRC